jgi:Kef-type K+ transport system membrane component KefB
MIGCAFFTQAAGVDIIFGAFLCGLIVPHDRGFAIALTEKIEDLICIMFLPLYFGYAGLNVNLAKLNNGLAWGYVVLVIFVACGGIFCFIFLNVTIRENYWMYSCRFGSKDSAKRIPRYWILDEYKRVIECF